MLFKDFYNEEKMEKNKSNGGIYFVIVTNVLLMLFIFSLSYTMFQEIFCECK